MGQMDITEDRLETVRALAEQIEAGNEVEANRLIDELSKLRENSLFQEVGKLTRELHDTLNGFQLDARVADLTAKDIPDAKERLQYVVTMTDQAAHKTMNAVDETLPVVEGMGDQAGNLHDAWTAFRERRLSADEFRGLSKEVDGFLVKVADDSALVHQKLTEVMMAQDYQDLTGQIISRVIKLVHEVEESLVELVRISGQNLKSGDEQPQGPKSKVTEKGQGPAVPGVDDTGDVVGSQDDVDDLLSSLGF